MLSQTQEDSSSLVSGMSTVWKENMKFTGYLCIFLALATAIAYIASLKYWVFGVALLVILGITAVFFSLAAGMWIVVAIKLQGSSVHKAVANFCQAHARVLYVLSLLFLTSPLAFLYILFFYTPDSASLITKVGETQAELSLQIILLVFIIPLTLLVLSMYISNLNRLKQIFSR